MDTIQKIKTELNTQATNETSIIAKAQEYTELETGGVKALLKAVQSKKKRIRKAAELETAKTFNMSRKEFLRLQRKAWVILCDFSAGYSMGDFKTLSINGKKFATLDHTQEYSGKYKGSETHGAVRIDLTKTELRNIHVVAGVWTVPAKKNKAVWLSSSGSKGSVEVSKIKGSFEVSKIKGSFEVSKIKGFLVGDSHATTLREAQFLQYQKGKDFSGNFKDSNFIGFQHIRNLGACEVGINEFCRKHKLNPKFGYRIEFLKTLNGAGTAYFNRLTAKS